MKILIVTLYGNNNFGNKLQNYALQEYLKKINKNNEVFTFVPKYHNIKTILYNLIMKFDSRGKKFYKFNSNINYYKKKIDINNPKIDESINYLVYGSDQIWNTNFEGKYNFFYGNCLEELKKISYAASFGMDYVDSNYIDFYKKSLKKFKAISVREDKGKEIVEKLTSRKDIEVLIDPTMLLSVDEWNKIIKKPKLLNRIGDKKFILNYFLGELSSDKKSEIDRIAKENDCFIINILDKNDPFYSCGPSEFLYLEKNAFLICTDSFHSSVFAILFNKPFIVFDREQKKVKNMSSRIDTLINKFKLKNRKFNGKSITSENLEHDYNEAYIILEKEIKKTEVFLKNSLK